MLSSPSVWLASLSLLSVQGHPCGYQWLHFIISMAVFLADSVSHTCPSSRPPREWGGGPCELVL